MERPFRLILEHSLNETDYEARRHTCAFRSLVYAVMDYSLIVNENVGYRLSEIYPLSLLLPEKLT
jgi:hypothetical protein